METAIVEARKELAPTGTLRAAINRGNGVLVQADLATGEPTGVAVDLARAAAERLQVPLEIVTYVTAGKIVAAIARDEWDVAFLAADLVRAEKVEFTAPYLIIEGSYVVRGGSVISAIADIDRPGVSIAAVEGSAYDLYLTRTIKRAAIVRSPTGAASTERFLTEGLDVLAGVKQALLALIKARPDLRIVEPPFMTIQQAMGTPKGRLAGAAFLKSFIEEMKSSGFVATALGRAKQHNVKVAPLVL